ncbi:MAG: response regulator [Chloroflexi bacterium]|nr:response regulator [Chloroflexota bacterium]
MKQGKWISDMETAVMLVDDDATNRNLVSEILDLCGYESIQASSGAQALTILTDQAVDVILLDIMMPDMDGWEFCRQLKQSINLAHIPIIMLTALVDDESRQKSFDVGADDFISKPFKMDDLVSRIEKQVKKAGNTN